MRTDRLHQAALVGTAALLCLLAPRDAFAYIDAATGSLILQGILAGVLGAMVVVRTYWQRLKSLFVRKDEPRDPEASPPERADGA